jgi:hypothetical protein
VSASQTSLEFYVSQTSAASEGRSKDLGRRKPVEAFARAGVEELDSGLNLFWGKLYKIGSLWVKEPK